MMFGTIMLILNVICWIFKGSLLMSWWWILAIYGIECAFYVVVYIVFAIIIGIIKAILEK